MQSVAHTIRLNLRSGGAPRPCLQAATGRLPGPLAFARGFTLLEVSITLVILGLLLAVAVPSINAISGAELRGSTGLLQGLIRDTYARTALSGNAHRVVMDIDNGTYWVEATTGGVVMRRERLALSREGGAVLDQPDERVEGLDDSRDEEDQEKLRLFQPTAWAAVPFPGQDRLDEVVPQRLPADVRFVSVWSEHLEDAARAGQVALHFFPGGYAEEAHVTLSDDEAGERSLTLVTNPLTGEVSVRDTPPSIPQEDE